VGEIPLPDVNFQKKEFVMLRGTVSLSQDQIKVEMAREHAILQAGKRFLSLRLINRAVNKIQGAICLSAIPYLDIQTNMTKFHFEETGMPLVFNIDEFRGGMYCKILDNEHNRNFLASMYNSNFWEIEDAEANKEIKEMAMNLSKDVVVELPVEKEIKPDNESRGGKKKAKEMISIEK